MTSPTQPGPSSRRSGPHPDPRAHRRRDRDACRSADRLAAAVHQRRVCPRLHQRHLARRLSAARDRRASASDAVPADDQQDAACSIRIFAFYGGTLFALTGALAAVLGGSTILAFEVVTLAAIAAAYGGLFWLARQLGVKGVLAHAPAIVFVTSAYYVTQPLRTGSVGGVHRRLGVAARARGVAASGARSLERRAGRLPGGGELRCSAAATTSRCCGARRSQLRRSLSTGC